MELDSDSSHWHRFTFLVSQASLSDSLLMDRIRGVAVVFLLIDQSDKLFFPVLVDHIHTNALARIAEGTERDRCRSAASP